MARTDAELLAAWRDGDRQAGGELFDRHFDAISRFFANKIGDDHEELVQLTFARCTESRDAFRGDASVRSYLFGIACNVLRDHLRRHLRDRERLRPAEHSVEDLGLPGPSTIAGARREQRILLAALRRLPLDHQIALELFYWERLSAARIGAALDLPEGTVRSRLRLAKERLRGHVDELARTPGELQSTLDNLERWAADIGQRLA